MRREFTVEFGLYRASKLNAQGQFRLLGLIMPIIPMLQSAVREIGDDAARVDAMSRSVQSLSRGTDSELEALLDVSFSVCEVGDFDKNTGDLSWAPIIGDDLQVSQTIMIVANVVQFNLEDYLKLERVKIASLRPPSDYFPVELPNNENWFYRPLVRNLCHYESLKDGTLDLADVAKMNDVLDVLDENEFRATRKH